jgi:hypothetical protein
MRIPLEIPTMYNPAMALLRPSTTKRKSRGIKGILDEGPS